MESEVEYGFYRSSSIVRVREFEFEFEFELPRSSSSPSSSLSLSARIRARDAVLEIEFEFEFDLPTSLSVPPWTVGAPSTPRVLLKSSVGVGARGRQAWKSADPGGHEACGSKGGIPSNSNVRSFKV